MRVLDLTTVFMGPSCAQYLGDLGADVIKVESLEGDQTRKTGPGGEVGLGALFLGLNRNKRSISVNLKDERGRQILHELARTADVFITNVRPKAIDRLGISYGSLKETNSRLIYCQLVGFSQHGPYASFPAYDDVIQAASGIPMLIAGMLDTDPVYVPLTFVDRSVAMYAFGVICAALWARGGTNDGQYVEVPMFETIASLVLGDHLYGQKFSPARGSLGYPRVLSPNRKPFRTKDGYICCLVYTDEHWKKFLSVLGKSALFCSDAKLGDIVQRNENIEYVYGFIALEMATKTTGEWVSLLRGLDLPIFPAYTLDMLLNDRHLREIGFIKEVVHPHVGVIKELRVPSLWSSTPPSETIRPTPALGEHTAELLKELHYSDEMISRLMGESVVCDTWQEA